jgi:hypothetical protein
MICISSEGFNTLCAEERDIIVIGRFEKRTVQVWIKAEVSGGKESKIHNDWRRDLLIAIVNICQGRYYFSVSAREG